MPVDAAPARPSWDYPRSPVASRHLLDTAAAHDIDPARCLTGTGLTTQALADPDTEIQADQELTIARNLLVAAGNQPGLGVETGLRYNLANVGILGYALLASPTVRDAVTVGLRYISLSSAFVTISLHESGTDAVLLLDDTEIPPDVRRFLLERDLSAMAQMLPLLYGRDLFSVPARIELRMPEPAALLPHLAATITFDAARNAVTVPRKLLDQPMPAADPHTAAACARQCQELLDRRRERSGIAGQVRSRLLRNPADIPSMTTVAAELAITERTLHRRLATEGTTYRALVDELRETLAVELLHNGLTVEEAARQLGYSETASFTHAYIRWRGIPPSKQPYRGRGSGPLALRSL
ncbi:MAG: helix-turn-helix domain-containing protein [Actinophytocola sp.]|nr:helix-turn-helix domain-containing protein [Actinophytocola sp.]